MNGLSGLLNSTVPRFAAGAALFIALAVAAMSGQQRAPQPGAPAGEPGGAGAPNKLGQPLVDPHGFVRDDAMLHAPMLLPEDRRYADLDGRRMKQFLMEVDAISLKDRDSGNLFWGRNVGTAAHVATEDWVEGYFRKAGLKDIHRLPFDLAPQWTPKAWELTFASGGKTYALESARPATRTASTPPEGLTWDLVWAGEGTTADFAGRDVKGKAVLIQDIPLPGDIRHSAQLDRVVERAFEKGAAAVGLMFGLSDNFAIWQGTAGRPGFNVGFKDGKVLRDLLGQGQPVKVTFKMTSEMRSGLKTASVLGTLPGTTDEDITIFAHMDGYFRASLDNASGLAVGVTADMDPGASGEMGTVARDVPSMQIITSPEIKHTEQDTPEWVPSSGLEEIARAYAKIIDEVNTQDRKALLP